MPLFDPSAGGVRADCTRGGKTSKEARTPDRVESDATRPNAHVTATERARLRLRTVRGSDDVSAVLSGVRHGIRADETCGCSCEGGRPTALANSVWRARDPESFDEAAHAHGELVRCLRNTVSDTRDWGLLGHRRAERVDLGSLRQSEELVIPRKEYQHCAAHNRLVHRPSYVQTVGR